MINFNTNESPHIISENIKLSYYSVTEGIKNNYNLSFKLSKNEAINIEANEGNKMNELIKSFYDTAEIPAFYGREDLITFKKNKKPINFNKEEKVGEFLKNEIPQINNNNNLIEVEDKYNLIQKFNKIKCEFHTLNGDKFTLSINKDKKMSELLQSFLDERELSEYFGRNDLISFKIRNNKIDFNNNKKVGKILDPKTNLIEVNDPKKLIEIKNIKCLFITNNQTKVEITINEKRKMNELLESFLKKTRTQTQKNSLSFEYNKNSIGYNCQDLVGNCLNKKIINIIKVKDPYYLIKNFYVNFKITTVGKKEKKIKIFIDKEKKMNELIKLFLIDRGMSDYFGREDLFKFTYNNQVIKHNCQQKLSDYLQDGNNNIINVIDNLDLIHSINIEIILMIIPSQPEIKEIKILINEEKNMAELIKLILEKTGIPEQIFLKKILKFTINEEEIKIDSKEKVGIFFKEKKNKNIIIEDKEDRLKNINEDSIKCIFNIINWIGPFMPNGNIIKGKKIRMFINKDKSMKDLIKLFMDKMSISGYYGREDLLQFNFDGKIVKHSCNTKVKIIKKENNIINVIDTNNLIQKINNITFTFKTGPGAINEININQGKSMGDLLKAYFDEIEMPYFYGRNIFTFIYNATKINCDNNEYIFNLINENKLNSNIIMVIDLNNLIENKN